MRMILKIKELLFQKHIRFTELHSKNSFLFDMFVRPVKYRNPENKSYPMHYGYEWCGKTCKLGALGLDIYERKNHLGPYAPTETLEEKSEE